MAGKEERTPRLTDRVGRKVPREQEHSRAGENEPKRGTARWQVAGGTADCLGTINLARRYFWSWSWSRGFHMYVHVVCAVLCRDLLRSVALC